MHARDRLTSAINTLSSVKLATTPPRKVGNGPHPVSHTPAFVIYCEEFAERKKILEPHLIEQGVEVTWWHSIYGKTWELLSKSGNGPESFALTLGHWNLWQHIWHLGIEQALIMEDDVLLTDGFLEKFHQLLSWIPSERQFLFVGILGDERDNQNKLIKNLDDGTIQIYYPYGTHCYLIRRSAIPILMNEMRDTTTAIDILLWYNVFNKYLLDWSIASPSLARQRWR